MSSPQSASAILEGLLLPGGSPAHSDLVLDGAYSNDVEKFMRQLQAEGELTEENNGWTALLVCAAKYGRSDIIELLLKHGAMLNTVGGPGTTAGRQALAGILERERGRARSRASSASPPGSTASSVAAPTGPKGSRGARYLSPGDHVDHVARLSHTPPARAPVGVTGRLQADSPPRTPEVTRQLRAAEVEIESWKRFVEEKDRRIQDLDFENIELRATNAELQSEVKSLRAAQAQLQSNLDHLVKRYVDLADAPPPPMPPVDDPDKATKLKCSLLFDPYTNLNVYRFTWTAPKTGPVARYVLTFTETTTGQTFSVDGRNCAHELKNFLPFGTYTFKVCAYFEDGNVGPWSDERSLSVEPPEVSGFGPALAGSLPALPSPVRPPPVRRMASPVRRAPPSPVRGAVYRVPSPVSFKPGFIPID